MSPKATEGVVRVERNFLAAAGGRVQSNRPPLAASRPSPPQGGRLQRYTSPRFTIIASGDGILPRKAV